MSREANMEMERSRRQHEHEKKFGKDTSYNNFHDNPIKMKHEGKEAEFKPYHSEVNDKGQRVTKYRIQEHEAPHWDNKK